MENTQNIKHQKIIPTWTKYLFQFCNVVLLIGAVISFAIFKKDSLSPYIRTPALICNIIGIIGFMIFLFFEAKIVLPLKFHLPPKWFKLILLTAAFYSLLILISVIIVFLFGLSQLTLILNIVILLVLTLVIQGFYTYIRFKMEKIMLMRRNGKNIDDQDEDKDRIDDAYKTLTEPVKTIDETDLIGKQATSGIYDETKK